MKIPSLLLFVSFCYSFAFAQSNLDTLGNIYDDLLKPNEGTLYLKNGSIVAGAVDYRPISGVVKLTTSERTETYTATTVSRCEFFDRQLSKQRYLVTGNVSGNRMFFEIIKDYGGLALLSLQTPVQSYHKTKVRRVQQGPTTVKDILKTSYSEVICIGKNGEIQPYVEIKTKEFDNMGGSGLRNNTSKINSRVIDRDLLKNLMGDKFTEVSKYVSSKKLDWTSKDDLVVIFDYYKAL